MNFFYFLRTRAVLLASFLLFTTTIFSQAIGDYRSRQSGPWNDVNTWEGWNGSSWVIPNANAFPVVSATAFSQKTVMTGTIHTVALPAGIVSGDLLIIFWADANDLPTVPGTPAGWTQLYTGAQTNRLFRAWYKIANGLEGTSVNITAGAERSAHTAYRVGVGTFQGVPIAGTMNTGSGVSPNPPGVTPAFGNNNSLWIAATHSEGDDNGPTPVAPTNYTNLITGYSGSTGTTHARVATAIRQREIATEDPLTFTLGSSVSWGANTVAIRGLTVGGTPTDTKGTITIRNTHIVTVATNESADQVTIDAGGTLSVNSGQTLTIANGAGTDLTVNGTVNNTGTITPTGTIVFNATGVYNHTQNGGTIPTATWNAASNCNVTGITNTEPAGLGQGFGNFTWNGSGQTASVNLDGDLTTVNGILTISSTNFSGGFRLELANAPIIFYGLTIGSNFIISNNSSLVVTTGSSALATITVGGNFDMSGTTSATSRFDFYTATGFNAFVQYTLDIAGNYLQSGGTFNFASGESFLDATPGINLAGNFSLTGTGLMTTSSTDNNITNGTITFDKSGTQTHTATTPGNISFTNFVVAASSTLQLLSNVQLSSSAIAERGGLFTVNGILNAGNNQVISSTGAGAGVNNAFTLNSGAGLVTTNVNGVQNTTLGTVSTSIATRTYNSGANFTFDGTAIQNSGIFTLSTPGQVNNLTINNSAGNTTTGVTLQQAFAVAGTLTLTSGHITSSATNLLTMNASSSVSGQNYGTRVSGGSNNSFINGPLRKAGNSAFLFPVGKVNAGHHYCGLSAAGAATDTFTVEYKRASAHTLGSITAPGLAQISNCEYWDIATTVVAPNRNVTLSWSGQSNCNAAVYVNDLATLVAAHFAGGSWNTYGGSSDAGSLPTAGSVTWNGVTTFSPFTLGSTSAFVNPLPVKLVNVKAYRTGGMNKIEWTNMTEADIASYEVERSLNGFDFTNIASISARSNNNTREDYSRLDMPAGQTIYYRIKVIANDGMISYSMIVKVADTGSDQLNLVVYPNPVTGKQFTLQLNAPAADYTLRIFGANGQAIKTENIKHPGGPFSKTIELPEHISTGQYYIQLTGGEIILNSKIIVQ